MNIISFQKTGKYAKTPTSRFFVAISILSWRENVNVGVLFKSQYNSCRQSERQSELNLKQLLYRYNTIQ